MSCVIMQNIFCLFFFAKMCLIITWEIRTNLVNDVESNENKTFSEKVEKKSGLVI